MGMEKSNLISIARILSVIGLLVQGFMILWTWELLPDIIPIHYNFSGNADGYGDKSDLFLLFGLSLGLYFGLNWLSRRPQKFNYPWKIDEKNAEHQHRLAAIFIQIIKAETIWLFTFISWQSIITAINGEGRLGTYFIILILIVSSLTVVGYLLAASRSVDVS